MIFTGSGDRRTGSVPAPSDRIGRAVNGENWNYLVVSATGSRLGIHSSDHTLTLVPAEARHPAHGEVVVGIDNASAWAVATVVGGHT